MGITVTLVRHCASAVDPSTSPATWGLTPEGRAQADSLRHLASVRPSAVLAGDEPKMIQTLEPLARAAGVPVEAATELRESRSSGWLDDGEEFLTVVRRFLTDPSSPPAPGWESADDAADRFLAKLDRVTTPLDDRGAVVVCSGGRVLTAALHRLGLLAADEVFSSWRRMAMPDVAVVELHGDRAFLREPFART